MADLADRISRAAVAGLDLAPFDDRFASLSRQVLAGGASRFGRVVSPDQPVHFVLPVGLPLDRIHYGALVVQNDQVGVLWRDPSGVDHSQVVPLGAGTTSENSAVELGGERWHRFDLSGPGSPLTFLVPPVNSARLRSTLVTLLGAKEGRASALSMDHQPEMQRPAVVVPDPEPETQLQPEDEPAVEAAPAQAADVTPEAVADEHEAEATQEMAPVAEDPGDETAVWAPESDGATQVIPERQPEPQPEPVSSDVPFDLYRDEDSTDATQVLATQPGATATLPDSSATTSQAVAPAPASARVSAVTSEVPGPVVAQGPSATLRGFLMGLFATLAIGGVFLLYQLFS